MKRAIVFIYTLFAALWVWGFDKKELADSITYYANVRSAVGRVSLPRVEQRGKTVRLYASKNLEWAALSRQDVAQLKRLCSQMIVGSVRGQVEIYTNGKELSELAVDVDLNRNGGATSRYKYVVPTTDKALTVNQSRPYTVDKGLEGKHLAIYGSHGLYYNQLDDRWIFQRAKLLMTVEDLYTSSYVMTFLVPMLENAGAVVLQPKERDTQPREVIIDDKNLILPQGWKRTSQGGWGAIDRCLIGYENPFEMGGYAVQEVGGDAELRYGVNVPVTDRYGVYVSYKTQAESTDAAEYVVVHSGIQTIFRVNQQMGGSTWVWLGEFQFTANDLQNNYITVRNRGKHGSVLTSDAIKIGGGMGSVGRYNDTTRLDMAYTSGYARYIEGSRYWLQYAGMPDSVYSPSQGTNDYTDDFGSRGRWVNYLAGGSAVNKHAGGLGIPVHLGLAFHTDAGLTMNDSTIGTLTIYTDYNNEKKHTYPTGISRMAAREYAAYIQEQIVHDVRQTFAPEWQRRETKNASYSETRMPDVPMIILELLSHQNLADMRYGLDPRFRFVASRAVYKGILKYLSYQYGTDYVVEPLPVADFSIALKDENTIDLSWTAVQDSLEPTATPQYYIVYERRNDGDWDNGRRVETAHLELQLDKDVRYDFRVAAGNEGGLSLSSETLSAHISSSQKGRVMIINGFDRVGAPESFRADEQIAGFNPLSSAVAYGKDVAYIGKQYEFRLTERWKSDDAGGYGASWMDRSHYLTVGNTFDYPVMHGRELARMGYTYVSTAMSAVDSISSRFDMVDVIFGKQRPTVLGVEKQWVDYTLLPEPQLLALQGYIEHGGRALVSGAYVASCLSEQAEGRQFLQNYFGATLVTDKGTHTGQIRSVGQQIGGTYELWTVPNEFVIHAERVDGVRAAGSGNAVVLRYADTSIGAAVANENSHTLLFAFPLESVKNGAEIYERSINWLMK